MQSAITFLPCVVALLAWPATTTKHGMSPATFENQHGHSLAPKTPIRGDAKLHQVLILLSTNLPRVQGHQTPLAQQGSKDDAANIARQVKLNRRRGLKNLLHAMYSEGGAQRIANAMPPLLILGYRREDVYQWLKDGISSPPARSIQGNVEVGDDENPLAPTRTQAGLTLEDAESEQVGEDSLAAAKRYYDGELDALFKASQQPEVSGVEVNAADEDLKTVVQQAQPLLHSDEPLPLENLDLIAAAQSAMPFRRETVSKSNGAINEALGTRAAETQVEPEHAFVGEILDEHIKRFQRALGSHQPAMPPLARNGAQSSSQPPSSHILQSAQMAMSDAAELMMHSANNNSKGVKDLYEKMMSNGGKDRLNRAEALAVKMQGVAADNERVAAPAGTQRNAEAAGATANLAEAALQADQQTKGTQRSAEEAFADAEQLVKYGKVHDSLGLRSFYDMMVKDGGLERVNRAEAMAAKMREGALSLKLGKQASADAEALLKYAKVHDRAGMRDFYHTMVEHGGLLRVNKAEAIAEKMKSAAKGS